MNIVIKKRAQNNLAKVASWIAEQYFTDTATRWLDEFELSIQEIARMRVKHAICNHNSLAKYNYRCFTFKRKWVVAYKITPSAFTVYKFMLGAKLK